MKNVGVATWNHQWVNYKLVMVFW